MLTEYVNAALKRALYERLEDDEGWFASIPNFPGLWAGGKTIEETREELKSVLERWIILGPRHGEKTPLLDGIVLTPELPEPRAS